MFGTKKKAITFSYDDGVTQDVRLIALFDKYGMKGTFNLNSGLMGLPGELVREGATVSHVKIPRDEAPQVYRGHEVAAHTVTHPNLTEVSDEAEIVRQIEEDRAALSDIFGYEVRGFAYPGGWPNFDDRVAGIVRAKTGVSFARTTASTLAFGLPGDPIVLKPTVHQHSQFSEMERLLDEFLSAEAEEPMLFYIWGHAYELDIRDEWERLERFLDRAAGHDDVFYGTNSQCLSGRV